MYPIIEQHNGQQKGHIFEEFALRFAEICTEHMRTNRARSFAFIFYHPGDGETQSMLLDERVLHDLDRLSGNQLSVFYLSQEPAIDPTPQFNKHFLAELGFEAQIRMPCVVFFTVDGERVGNIELRYFAQDFFRGFHQLHDAMADYLRTETRPLDSSAMMLGNSPSKLVALDAIKRAMRESKLY